MKFIPLHIVNSLLVHRILIICTCLVLSGIFVYPLSPAYGIRNTPVKHLFTLSQDFSQPSDLAVSEKGLIYVVDGVNHSIKVFNSSGIFQFSFGQKGSSNGHFQFPLGITIDSADRVYVADSGNHRVQIFNASGAFITKINIPEKGTRAPDPTDVAVDETRNRLYIVDNENHYIIAYNLNTRELIDTYGSAGMEKREFRYPFLMTLDHEKYLYVVDVVNTRLQVLNPEGLFLGAIGGWGVEKGEFFRPKGVAVDNNLIYVSDSYMGVIQVFRQNGEFHSVIGHAASGDILKFTTPTGIFIDKHKRLYVVEMFADRVSVYEIQENTE
jgi:DNA-binding beta-propeller fold protein YncE